MTDNTNVDHELELIKDLHETDRLIVICGDQGSGKSYMVVSFINFAIAHNMYDEIHFISPTLHVERHQSYDFMKKNKIFHLYTNFDDTIIEKMKNVDKRKLLICDDATAYLIENRFSPRLVELVTCVRHYRTTMFVLIHSLSYVLLPTIRNNINHMFIGNFMNDAVIKQVWQSFLSRKIRKYEDFYMPYDDSQNIKQNLIYFSCKDFNGVDFNVKEWEILKYHDKVVESGSAKIYTPKTDDQKYVEKVKKEIHNKKLKEKIVPRKKLVF